MKPLFAMAFLLLVAAAPARADEKIDCKSQDLNQMQLDQCAGQDFTASDKRLNTLYRTLMAKYDAANAALLKDAQRKWLAFRDSECSFESNGFAEGSIYPMAHVMCLTDKTNARVKELNAQLNCAEGDLSCNMPSK